MDEIIDHLYENFIYPYKIKNGAYMIPTENGYSATIRKETIEAYKFPKGSFWLKEKGN